MDWTALGVSLRLGIATIILLLPLGIWLGRLLAGHEFRGKLFVETLVTVPLVLPPSVLGFYLLSVFGGRSWLRAGLVDDQVGRPIASPLVSAYSDPALPGFGDYV